MWGSEIPVQIMSHVEWFANAISGTAASHVTKQMICHGES